MKLGKNYFQGIYLFQNEILFHMREGVPTIKNYPYIEMLKQSHREIWKMMKLRKNYVEDAFRMKFISRNSFKIRDDDNYEKFVEIFTKKFIYVGKYLGIIILIFI